MSKEYLERIEQSGIDLDLFRYSVSPRFMKTKELVHGMFVEHGPRIKRIKVCVAPNVKEYLTPGLALMAAKYAAKKGWKKIYIRLDEYKGYQLERITFLNADQVKNIRAAKAWSHARPVIDISELRYYLDELRMTRAG